jgi:thioredoxin reductase (NADPH)
MKFGTRCPAAKARLERLRRAFCANFETGGQEEFWAHSGCVPAPWCGGHRCTSSFATDRLADFEGGVYYAATEIEARHCRGAPKSSSSAAAPAGQGCDVQPRGVAGRWWRAAAPLADSMSSHLSSRFDIPAISIAYYSEVTAPLRRLEGVTAIARLAAPPKRRAGRCSSWWRCAKQRMVTAGGARRLLVSC